MRTKGTNASDMKLYNQAAVLRLIRSGTFSRALRAQCKGAGKGESFQNAGLYRNMAQVSVHDSMLLKNAGILSVANIIIDTFFENSPA
ncbi:MAG: hypothetical protein E7414_01155 [Ruminococcaceae bacterium]|nr:hypothetical protein [Oscillospiraceae bacterium]